MVKSVEKDKEASLGFSHCRRFDCQIRKTVSISSGMKHGCLASLKWLSTTSPNVRKYPQIAKAFDDYGHLKNPLAAGNVPIGKGVMRVIPIESALDGETRRASSEEVSGYIRNARLLSVSDCSCRTSREEMGEGCGHLKEEMCIQLDDAAEYYIRTGRGREVTKEEALEIIRKAERDGLMHQIPNTEGEGHTHAICNCCGCSCYAIRAAGMYHNPDMVRSNYISQVDPETALAVVSV